MAQFLPGDSVVCRIKDSIIVSAYEDKWEEELVFDIMSMYEEGYMIYIPIDMYLRDCVHLTSSNHKKYNAEKRFIDSDAYYITDYKIIRIHRKLDGIRCMKCDTFCGMATSNRPDNKLLCWHCSKYPTYM